MLVSLTSMTELFRHLSYPCRARRRLFGEPNTGPLTKEWDQPNGSTVQSETSL